MQWGYPHSDAIRRTCEFLRQKRSLLSGTSQTSYTDKLKDNPVSVSANPSDLLMPAPVRCLHGKLPWSRSHLDKTRRWKTLNSPRFLGCISTDVDAPVTSRLHTP